MGQTSEDDTSQQAVEVLLRMVAKLESKGLNIRELLTQRTGEQNTNKPSTSQGDSEFTEPKNPGKRIKLTQKKENIPLNNKFESLTPCAQMETDDQTDNESEEQPQNAQQQAAQKPTKIAPIIIREKSKWTRVSKLMCDKHINFKKARIVSQGVHIEPTTEDDYRKLYKVLRSENIEFYTYELKSEKKLKIVLRGVLVESTEEEIKDDLTEQGYPATKVIRMKGKKGQPAPLVLIELDKCYKSIYRNLKRCCGLSVEVESLRTRNGIIQCHRCQLFGHSQKNWHATFKCMKCGEEHMTSECTKPKTTAPKCANCGGEHLSTSLKCTKNPNNIESKKPKPSQLPVENVWKKRAEEQKMKEAAKLKQVTKPAPVQKPERKSSQEPSSTKTNSADELATIIGRMAIQFAATNATIQQQMKYLEEQNKLIALFNKQRN